MELEEVAAIAMTVSAFKTRHLFTHKFRPYPQDEPHQAAVQDEPAPEPGRT